MKRYLITAAVLAAVGAVLGLIVAASGIMTITASAGHFAITERFLIFAKQRSVATHTLGTPAPPLGEPSAVLKGAGHFDTRLARRTWRASRVSRAACCRRLPTSPSAPPAGSPRSSFTS